MCGGHGNDNRTGLLLWREFRFFPEWRSLRIGRWLSDLAHRSGRLPIGGIALVVLGAFIAWEASSYQIGQLTRMGPGYFPVMVGVLMSALGGAVAWQEWRSDRSDHAQLARPGPWRIITVLAAIAGFGFFVNWFGVVPAVIVLVMLSTLSERPYRFPSSLITAVVLAGMAYGVFIELMRLPLRAFRCGAPWIC